MGARTVAEVEAPIIRLSPGSQPLAAGPRGVLAGYEWVVGRRHRAPVSGADIMSRLPSDVQIAGEEHVALRQLHDWTPDLQVRDFASGVALALAWVLGHTNDQP
ncbi:hypothetical protein A6A07_09820 [Streptomyces sp. CB03911]|nr:hypothetical protein A6A07_09820 [Streptomyces sp. CB03911]